MMPIEMQMLTSASAADIRSSMVDALPFGGLRAMEFETFPATRALKMRESIAHIFWG
jgi:hypothetical protein